MVYSVSSRTAKTIQRSPVFKLREREISSPPKYDKYPLIFSSLSYTSVNLIFICLFLYSYLNPVLCKYWRVIGPSSELHCLLFYCKFQWFVGFSQTSYLIDSCRTVEHTLRRNWQEGSQLTRYLVRQEGPSHACDFDLFSGVWQLSIKQSLVVIPLLVAVILSLGRGKGRNSLSVESPKGNFQEGA